MSEIKEGSLSVSLNHKRIVVTFLMHLGDVILTTPFLEVLRRLAPDSHITYVVDKKLSDVVRYSPYVDDIIEVDKKGKDDSLSALWKMGRTIHKTHPDVVINLHPNERTSFLAFAIGAPITVGMSHFLFRPFLTKVTRLDRRNLHAARMYVNVLEQLGAHHTEEQGLHIELCEAWKEKAKAFYEAAGLAKDQSLIGFNIGSAVKEKRWPGNRFAEVADYFAGLGYGIVFFGGPMDEELVQDAVQYMKTTPIIATGKFSIGELAAAMKRCAVIITNDSGPMHVAVSQKVPVVTLYGPSNPKFYGPYSKEAIVLESMDSYEEGKSMKQVIREGKYRGVEVIEKEAVITAVEQLLSRNV